jgi:hypothetical protein
MRIQNVLSSKPRSWFDRAIEQPMKVYATPADVLRDERLDEAGMRAVLEAWLRCERSRMEAAGFIGESPSLRKARAAIAEVDRLARADA